MISYRTKRLHARSRINRIFSRVVFLKRKLGVSVFSSLFMWGGISPVGSDLEWQSQRKNHFKKKWVFPLPAVIYLTENLFGLKISCPLSCFPLLIGNYSVFLRSFPFYFLPIFDRESFFSFSFLSFHFLPIFDWEFRF